VLLVPALAADLGDRVWWPGQPAKVTKARRAERHLGEVLARDGGFRPVPENLAVVYTMRTDGEPAAVRRFRYGAGVVAMFGEVVRRHRTAIMATQEEVAAKAGMSVRHLREIEAGRVATPRASTVRLLAMALQLSGAERAAFQRAARAGSAEPEPAPAGRAEPSAPQVRPAQLPARAVGFVGRAAELDAVDAAGDQVVLVVGPAGVGKTALVLQWAHAAADRFADGQLYVNLRGFDPSHSPADPADVLHSFLGALGLAAARIPAGLDGRAALFRSLLARRRVLIVLDNAAGTDQVRPLLPGNPACRVLVTSRDRLTGLVVSDAAHLLPLSPMDTTEARALLRRRLGKQRVAAEPAAVDRLIDRCQHLPIALALVAAQLAARPGSAVGAFAAEIGDPAQVLDSLTVGDPHTDIRAVFSWSYGKLSEPAARLFRLLAVHPGPDVSVHAAASTAGVGETAARRLLVELDRTHLVREHLPGRYEFHDLLRAYAMELITRTDQADAAFARLIDHYLHSAAAADRLLNPLRRPSLLPLDEPAPETSTDPVADPAAWFSAERLNLLAVHGRAADAGLARQTWQLAWAADTALERLGHWQDLVESWKLALAAIADTQARAYGHRRLAHGFTLLGRDTEAEAELGEVLRLYEESGDLTGQAVTHHSLSFMYDSLDDVGRARQHAELARACAERAGDNDQLASALNALGWCHTRLGEHARALTYCRRALALIDPANPRTLASTWDTIGYAHHHLGEYDQAVDAYHQALAKARQAEDRHEEATLLTHLGDTHLAAGDRASARAAWRPAIDLLTAIDAAAADTLSRRLTDLAAGGNTA
jgi:transcriptional regulator with XRE-family HTH domain/Tfp pilus assembly protein PilF